MGSQGWALINPEAREWYYKTIGNERLLLLIHGGKPKRAVSLIAPLPGATDLKTGFSDCPFFSVYNLR